MLRDCRVMPYTLVAFHAHPDDEALLTSGTMARAAAEGHRVVLVVATDGELGLASTDFTAGGGLAAHRRAGMVLERRIDQGAWSALVLRRR